VDPVHFSDADASDVAAIADLHADSWRRNYRGAFSDSFLDGDVHRDRRQVWKARLAEAGDGAGPGAGTRTIVARTDSGVVGFVHTVYDHDPTWGALVDNLHVTHELKGQGVGRTLMGHAAQAVLTRDPSSGLYLWVLEQNTAAQGFYAALGGTTVERVLRHEPGGGRPPGLRIAWRDPSVLLPESGTR
jgi:ribosomal protein S18 acetylase RimI-like enzyme